MKTWNTRLTLSLCVMLAALVSSGCPGGEEELDHSCTDSIQNGDETDVDCGGLTCSPCADGMSCALDGDCLLGSCEEGVCQAVEETSCDNGVRDGLETDIDCGGADCPPCEEGESCLVDGDCLTDVCESGICATEVIEVSCDNGVQDGLESDVDCGGPDCPPCASGFGCGDDQDCGWMECMDGVCGGLRSCLNYAQDGHETDVDCGGPFCHGCGTGRACILDSDCLSEDCQNGFCTEPSTAACENGDLDEGESDVDCGGGLCQGCADGFACETMLDCEFGHCQGGMCGGTDWMCANLMQDGRETDVDCGGGLCPPCTGGKICVVDDNCLSELCEAGVCAARALTCDNGIQDGRETDIDCGASCDPCGEGMGCNLAIECTTLACVDNVCGRNLVTLQSGEESMTCATSGMVVVREGVSLFGLSVVSPILELDAGKVGFWVQEPGAWLSIHDGRFAGIFVVADTASAEGVEQFQEIAIVGDYVENDCHSELHVTTAAGDITITPDYSVFGSPTAVEPAIFGGAAQDVEPYEGVLVFVPSSEIVDIEGYDGPEEPGSPRWWFKLEGDILITDEFKDPFFVPVVGEKVTVTGFVVERQGKHLVVAREISQDAFGW